MSEAIATVDKTDIVETTKPRVACDGPEDGRHPRVFLTLDPETGEVVCPYCSRVFVRVDS